ncbi:MAG: YbjN domain-containing protein [Pseudomonadota bacterium]
MYRFLAATLIAASIFAATAPASAQNGDQIVGGVTGMELQQILSAAGFSASVASDRSTGAPVIVGQAGQFPFYVRTFGCEDDGGQERCDQLLFFANIELDREITEEDYKIVNRYNESKVFGRGYVIEERQAVGVDFAVNLRGGVTISNLADSVSNWINVLDDFIAQLNTAANV